MQAINKENSILINFNIYIHVYNIYLHTYTVYTVLFSIKDYNKISVFFKYAVKKIDIIMNLTNNKIFIV